MKRYSSAFTLVEVLVVTPIIILSIGAFIALVVALTGNTLSSRGSSALQYEVRDALDRIEDDIRKSAAILASTDIALSGTNPQGYLASPSTPTSTGSTIAFTNVNKTSSGGSPAALILKQFATNVSAGVESTTDSKNILYLANTPAACSGDYKLNTPMYVNVVYFVAENTLWRRTIVPTNYATPSSYCGGAATQQQPSCAPATTHAYCKVKDTKLVEGVTADDFIVDYFTAASGVTNCNTTATNPGATDVARNSALALCPSVRASVSAKRMIAGKEVIQKGTAKTARLNSTITTVKPVTPMQLQASVFDGRKVKLTWSDTNRSDVTYISMYRVNGGTWTLGDLLIPQKTSTITVNHGDTVDYYVVAVGSDGSDAISSTASVKVPLWAPLPMANNWENYGQGYTTGAYTRTSAGLVIIKGLLRNLGSPAIDTTIATLPADYWPTGRLMFGTSTNPNASSRLDVTQTGSIQFHDNSSAPWVSMDTIRYTAANAGYTRTTPTLLNGFTNYGSVYAPASYVQDSTGRVSIQGLLANGTRTDNTPIFSMPAALRPALHQHHASRSGTFSHIGMEPGSGVVAKGTGTGAYSVNSIYLPSSHSSWSNLSLTNGWVAYGGFSSPQYTKTGDGVVHLKGLIRSGTIGSVPLATLPEGFRPSERILSATVSNAAYARIDILPNGQVHATTGNNLWYALDSISFLAEQ